ncbi:hypothetical protein RJT00_02975 [Segatella copri]|uniref:hypothetical protein n=1 Tax=Segatella copri TaxID=165179 RepID=UPI00293ACFFD|nr:hypothetical protein [Segatella copri]MDV3105477.1 hypothetical protein [Segatella copri]MDV3112334.1 hypothetical protein [Segatella copri]
MRKTLLFAAALCLAATTATAQTFADPLTPTEGNNSYQATSPSTIYWKFTADADYIATFGQYGDSEVPMVAIESNGRPSYITGVTASDWVTKIFALEKGKTYYFTINAAAKGEVGFSLKLDKTENLGAGLTAEKPVEIKVGTTQLLGNPCYPEDSYDDVNVYTTFKAEKDGQLQIKTEQYVSSAKVDGTAISAEIVNGKKVFKINTKAGNTYAINFTLGIPFFIATSEVVEVKEGAIDMPYVMKEGENTIPAEAGKYFFTYKPDKTGYLNITSDAKTAGNKVSIYRNKINATNGNNAAGQSADGSYDVRAELTSTYYTYYIVVDKTTATDKAETFNVKMEDYQPGETAGTAIPVNVSETATAITLPGAKGKYFYTITVPANTKKLLTVESTAALSEGTSAYVNTSEGDYGATKMENQIIKRDVNSTREQKYYLVVTSNEATPLTLNIRYADVEKGSLITEPKEAKLGQNTIDFDGTEYYTYKATKSGKLAIEVSDGAKVTFPLSATGYGVNDTYQKGNTYFIQATKGEEYLITISDVKKGSTFNLAETDFEAGELKSNPIVMTEDTYILGENTGNLWLKYTVTKTGIIDFSSDVPFDDDFFIGIAKNDASAPTSMADDIQDAATLADSRPNRIKLYQSTFEVKEGDVLNIQVQMPGDVKGKKITLTQRAPEAGESINNPIILTQGKTINVAKASLMKPIWVKANLVEGDNTFEVAGGSATPMSNCRLSGDGITYEGQPVAWDANGTKFSVYSSKAGEFVFMIGYAEGNATLTFIDPTGSGISHIETATDSKPAIYTINGTKINSITGSGVYIIKSNGKTKKVVIKK